MKESDKKYSIWQNGASAFALSVILGFAIAKPLLNLAIKLDFVVILLPAPIHLVIFFTSTYPFFIGLFGTLFFGVHRQRINFFLISLILQIFSLSISFLSSVILSSPLESLLEIAMIFVLPLAVGWLLGELLRFIWFRFLKQN